MLIRTNNSLRKRTYVITMSYTRLKYPDTYFALCAHNKGKAAVCAEYVT